VYAANCDVRIIAAGDACAMAIDADTQAMEDVLRTLEDWTDPDGRRAIKSSLGEAAYVLVSPTPLVLQPDSPPV